MRRARGAQLGRREQARRERRRGGGRARTSPPRARVCSRITSTSAAIASALPGSAGVEPLEQREPVARSARRPTTAAGSTGRSSRGTSSRTGRRQHDAIRGEIVERQLAASVADRRHDRARPLAAVEGARAAARDRLERVRELGQPQRVAGDAAALPLGVAVDALALGASSAGSDRAARACAPAARVSSTPSRASSIAGASSSRHGSRPYARCAASSPATAPGTAHEAGPIRNGCVVVASPKPTSTTCISPPRWRAAGRGPARRRRSRRGASSGRARGGRA